MDGHPPAKPYLHSRPATGMLTTLPILAPDKIHQYVVIYSYQCNYLSIIHLIRYFIVSINHT